ncbi:lipopolysaccharide biosynthesis protein [Desulfosarcina alkanivorans]|uniref:Lipopolysaccharide biosynthesis protein n=1 Tax=Desulfosarcina alkanivorans TaxID=571177 RepID=A0A5K7YGU2_9BACT|nr:lipopolysaccharide biosynthesis protein [Desulfosarcina alkanivorans]
MTPADYGLMALAGVVLTFMHGFKDLGIGVALIQRKYLDESLLGKSFGFILQIGLLLFCLGYILSPVTATFFGEDEITPIMRLLSLNFIFIALTVIPQTLLRREMDFRKIGLLNCIAALVGCVVTLSLAILGKGVWALVWGTFAIKSCKMVIYNFSSSKFIRPQFGFTGMKGILSFGGKATVNDFIWQVSTSIDVFIIGKLLGKELLGFYSVAKHLASLLMDKLSPILQEVAFPAYSKIQNDLERVKRGFLKSVGIVAFVCFPIFWGISSVAPSLVVVVLGEQWQLAAVPLQLIALVIPLRMANTLIAPLLGGVGKIELLIINQINFLLIISLSLFVGVRWELFGVSFAWVLGFPVIFSLNMFICMRAVGGRLTEVLSLLVKPVVFSLLMYLCVSVFGVMLPQNLSQPITLVTLIALGVFVYTGLTLSLGKSQYKSILALSKKS